MHLQPVFNPQITQITQIDGKEKRYKASPSEIRSDKLNTRCCDFVNLTRQAGVNEFHGVKVIGGEVAEDLFNRGLCLPSGTAMTEEDLERVVSVIHRCCKGRKQQ